MSDSTAIPRVGDISERELENLPHKTLVAFALRAQSLATIDDMTQILNHRAFEEEATRHFNRMKRNGDEGVMLLLDIDLFKRVNDTYGHLGGNEVIKKVASIMEACTRPSDLCGRYGGEEFIIFLPNTGKQESKLVAERIRTMVEGSTVKFESHDISCTVSIGLALLSDAEDLEGLIGSADRALYKAKGGGRNRVVTADANLNEKRRFTGSSDRRGQDVPDRRKS